VITGPDQLHLSYVHTPMRFAWDLQEEYLRAAGLDHGPLGWAARFALRRLRAWDVRSAKGVDAFLANSSHVAGRIGKTYGREAEILHPPIDTALFVPGDRKEDFYLTVSRLEAYKRVDLLVEAFAAIPERRLVVIGDGPEMKRLRSAAPRNVSFPGRLATPDVRKYMQRARAFLFAGIEDFGIVMAEAQACGTPVIAFEDGGAVDIVRAGVTGLLFREQTPGALTESIRRFERGVEAYSQSGCRENALRFDRKVFRQRFEAFVRRHWEDFARDRAASRPRNAVS
jgi:glycosyltransferase involved in cell wall biosynthesis